MAKYKVNHPFKNKETGEIYHSGQEIEITVKRAKEINKNNKNKVEMVTRLEEEEGD
nr:MAG TPA_asm: hypothetical protein [Caudoviricetes sp.]